MEAFGNWPPGVPWAPGGKEARDEMAALREGGERDQRAFWNRRAKTFPGHSPAADGYEVRVLGLAKEAGVALKGARVLDIGCGAGLYAIRLAMEAERVTALDISEEMLKVVRRDAEALGIKNIDFVNADWLDYGPVQGYDVLWCSMTPAMGSDAGREKAAGCLGARVAYIGWNGRKPSNVMESLLARFKAEAPGKGGGNAAETREWLEARGIPYQAFPVEGTWRKPFSKEDLLAKSLMAFSDLGAEADPIEAAALLERHKEADGRYWEITDYKLEMLTWKNPPRN